MLHITLDQRVHIREHHNNPITAWKALKDLFVQQKAGTRFVAYDEFFSIRKCPEESLTALSARVEHVMARIKELHPSTFDLTKLDDKLTCMALIHSLGPDHTDFIFSLALLMDLDKDKVKAAFQTEDINRRPCPDMAAAMTSALSATTTTTSCKYNLSLPCTFCEKCSHCVCKCFALQHAKTAYKTFKGKRRKPNIANQAQAQPTSSSTTPLAPSNTSSTPTATAAAANIVQDVVKHAGNASDRSSDTSVPSSTSQ